MSEMVGDGQSNAVWDSPVGEHLRCCLRRNPGHRSPGAELLPRENPYQWRTICATFPGENPHPPHKQCPLDTPNTECPLQRIELNPGNIIMRFIRQVNDEIAA